jgi:hypothetical protein
LEFSRWSLLFLVFFPVLLTFSALLLLDLFVTLNKRDWQSLDQLILCPASLTCAAALPASETLSTSYKRNDIKNVEKR